MADTLGSRLRKAIDASGLTVRQLAALADKPTQTIYVILADKSSPSVDTLRALVRHLPGTSFDDLLQDAESATEGAA